MPTIRTINFQEKGNSSDVEIDIITETATEDTGSKMATHRRKKSIQINHKSLPMQNIRDIQRSYLSMSEIPSREATVKDNVVRGM